MSESRAQQWQRIRISVSPALASGRNGSGCLGGRWFGFGVCLKLFERRFDFFFEWFWWVECFGLEQHRFGFCAFAHANVCLGEVDEDRRVMW